MDDICDLLITSFPNYKKSMYDGNEPCGKGHKRVDGGENDRWETKYGSGETYNDEIVSFSFSLSHKISIYIIGDLLNIVDNRYAGKFDEWCYCNKPNVEPIHGCSAHNMHKLEPERIKEYLNVKIPNCKIWDMVQKRAKELANI